MVDKLAPDPLKKVKISMYLDEQSEVLVPFAVIVCLRQGLP